MPSPTHIGSYYAATAHPSPVEPPLRGEVTCDVCVVGGGITGCSAALHLVERGYRVVLVEAQRIGWGASGRSGAQVLPGYPCGQDKLVELVGRNAARRLWTISVEALALVRQLIERHHIACDWVSGHLMAAVKPRHCRELLYERESLELDYDYRGTRYLEREELQERVATDRYLGGLFDPHAGHIHPLNYTLGLAAAARRAGAQIYEGTRAVSFDATRSVLVQTRAAGDDGQVRCRQLVLCANASMGDLVPVLGRKVLRVGSYIIATAPLGEARARGLIANNMAVNDLNWILDYFRRSADHRLLFGGRVSYSGLKSGDTSGPTRARMLKVFPQLADVHIDYSWGGYVDITMNRAPHFGRLAPEVYFLQGFSGHGISLAGMAGKLVAEAVAGSAERLDMFERIPHHDFPGGALLRRPLLVLAMLYYRLRDLL